ncbi:unnamed protein product, partial [Musa textilis]
MLLTMGSLVGLPSSALGVNPSTPLLRNRCSPLLFRRRRRFLDLGASSTSPASAVARNGSLATNSSPQSNCVYTVGDFMTKRENLHVVKPTTSVDEALEMLVEHRITGFPVIDDDWNLVGVVSDYDLLALDSISGSGRADTSMFPEVDSTWKAFNEIQKLLSKTNGRTIGEVMTPAPLVVRETTNLEDVARQLLETKYRRLPVVDSDGKLIVLAFYGPHSTLMAPPIPHICPVLRRAGSKGFRFCPDPEGEMAQIQLQPQAVSGPAAGGGGVQFPSTSLYVGDLDLGVTDAQLYDIFSQIGQVVSVRVCRDINTRRSLGYAYVNYNDPADAARAIEVLNFTPLNGKTIRIMISNRDPSTRRSGTANIFIKNLDKSIDNKALYDTFSAFGNILSCKVATDASGASKGYGFVQFEQEEAAQNAIEKLNGMLLNDKKVFVGPFVRKQERENAAGNTKFNNVFVKNLSESMTEDTLQEVFGEFGKITSCIVMREGDGKSKCFGFVNFENPDDAARAVQELDGKKFDDKEWYVGKAQKKSEREQELKERFEQSKQEATEKSQGVNLYLKNLDDSIGDDNLRELFSGFGAIASCKIMRDKNGASKGSGFVAFQSPEDASRALLEMNGKMIGNKPLYVALAQRKEDRRARLQAQFSQMRPVAMPPSIAPRVPLYPPGGPGLGQPLFYGQPPALVPPQPGFGFQQPLVPGMRPGPFPSFYMQMAQQGQQQVQRPGSRRAGGGPPVQQTQQHPMQMIQQQMLPRGGRPYRYPPGRSMPEVPMSGIPGGMFSLPYDMGGGMPQPTVPIGELASALANATPEQQRTMLGESLYPLVDQLEHDYSAKVTGMLLEMDQTEVLHLLESPEALKAKVAEAMEVLRSVAAQQQHQAVSPTDRRMALLSLLDHLYCQEDNLELEDERIESVLPLAEDRETERYVLLAAEAEDEQEWAEVLCSLAAKEGEALGELVPHGCGGDSYLPSARKAAVEWVARSAATFAFSALTAVLAVNYLDRCFLSCAAGGGLLRLRDGKPWMGRLAAMACLSLAAKVEETRDPFLIDLQVPAPREAAVEEDEGEFVFESKTIKRMELVVLSALGWRMNPVTPLSFIHHVLPRLFSKAENADSPATAIAVRIQTVMRRCEAALLSVIAGR